MSISPRMPSAGPGVAQATQTARPILTRVVIQLFCVELGLILLLLPWTLLWDNNFFFSLQPQYSRFWLSNELRGAVSGIGIVNLWVAIGELARMVSRRAA
ncbi:MAG: hypothetical protein OXC19_22480 [Bryobacterales bacterium]|nr:hypothetical protein [Bryobacterales bacterium]